MQYRFSLKIKKNGCIKVISSKKSQKWNLKKIGKNRTKKYRMNPTEGHDSIDFLGF